MGPDEYAAKVEEERAAIAEGAEEHPFFNWSTTSDARRPPSGSASEVGPRSLRC